MNVVVTGGDGFIARNLRVHLVERAHTVTSLTRESSEADMRAALADADFVFHLAGVNRPKDPAELDAGNVGAMRSICAALRATGRPIPVAFSSSTQAALENPYGRSKRAAEDMLVDYSGQTGASVYIFRLPNVFGKWARPNYNSAVATFCHNIARGLPIAIHDASAELRLVYVDDVVSSFISLMGGTTPSGVVDVDPVYRSTVGEVATLIESFARGRETLVTERVGIGLPRALHATYLSYLPPSIFAYALKRHVDPRGVFVEMLKTHDSGQMSYFTAVPGITRGEHYHHTKAEKFLVVAGTARFGFRHIVTGETFELTVDGADSLVVETVPGWAHNITNIGSGEMLVLLWANEIFDPQRPDTVASKVHP